MQKQIPPWALTPGVKDVFEIARPLTVFEVFETKEQALAPWQGIPQGTG